MLHEVSFKSFNERDTVYGWIYVPACEPKGIVQLIHGFGEHSRRYFHLIVRLMEAGYIVAADDHVGHGKTALENNTWGDWGNQGFHTMMEDEHQLKALVSELYPNLPYFLYGHSMGSMIARDFMTKYGEELVKKMQKSGAKAYLVNTGWNGTGKRISIKDTRGIIDAILDGSIDKAPTKKIPYFDFEVPTALPGVDPNILDPRDTYADAKQWDEKAKDLAERFIKNFKKFEGNEAGKKLVAAGPKL